MAHLEEFCSVLRDRPQHHHPENDAAGRDNQKQRLVFGIGFLASATQKVGCISPWQLPATRGATSFHIAIKNCAAGAIFARIHGQYIRPWQTPAAIIAGNFGVKVGFFATRAKTVRHVRHEIYMTEPKLPPTLRAKQINLLYVAIRFKLSTQLLTRRDEPQHRAEKENRAKRAKNNQHRG